MEEEGEEASEGHGGKESRVGEGCWRSGSNEHITHHAAAQTSGGGKDQDTHDVHPTVDCDESPGEPEGDNAHKVQDVDQKQRIRGHSATLLAWRWIPRHCDPVGSLVCRPKNYPECRLVPRPSSNLGQCLRSAVTEAA